MKQTALANKPNVVTAVRDDLRDPSNKLAVAVVAEMREFSGRCIQFFEAAIFSAKPKIPVTVFSDAFDRSTSKTIGIVRVMEIVGKPFGCRVEFVHARFGGKPEVAVVVFYQILKKIGAQASGIIRVVLVHYECITVVAVEPITRRKPHEPATILQNSNHISLR